MKLLAVLSKAALCMILGISVPLYAQQDEHPQEENRARPEHEQDKPAQAEDKHADKDRQEDKRAEQEDKRAEQQDKRAEQADKHAEQEDKTARQADRREDKRGGHIPDDRFRANFGREHRFHIGRPVIVEGAPRFRYGGYWFVIVEPWPVGWTYDDEVYVDYIDGGYFLFNPVHPGVRISINVAF